MNSRSPAAAATPALVGSRSMAVGCVAVRRSPSRYSQEIPWYSFGEHVVLAQRIADPVVRQQDVARIGVAGEGDAEHLGALALVPLRGAVDRHACVGSAGAALGSRHLIARRWRCAIESSWTLIQRFGSSCRGSVAVRSIEQLEAPGARRRGRRSRNCGELLRLDQHERPRRRGPCPSCPPDSARAARRRRASPVRAMTRRRSWMPWKSMRVGPEPQAVRAGLRITEELRIFSCSFISPSSSASGRGGQPAM